MANEKGLVIRTEAETAWVKTVRTSSCESCSSRKTCNTLGGGNEMEVETINTTGARVGDTVVFSFQTGPLLKVSFLVYVFPIICLLGGTILGQELAPVYGLDVSMASVIGGLIGFSASFFPIRLLGNRLAGKERYKPKIIRIDRRGPVQSQAPSRNNKIQETNDK